MVGGIVFHKLIYNICFFFRRAKQLEEEGMSYSYIASYVSRCPSCRAKVMKIGGYAAQ